ncbi:WD40-repeat-containing domain [Pseudocohnilembus persalinus]|uniref:WD40-repeat-containing domain n=1 Tax=Pseudocohnilembus persalinus TaxID=266149 RepID=A0A0V0R702_PSEPJ|nr:WD40-repeat-containing domain [Pseudocohnilembus persalinus]|eukprot:KRX10258.1 WD40-repeat-containing domain [Pseudocohnilembus persalinus]
MFDLEINFKQILNNYDVFANPFNHQKFMSLNEQKPLKPVLLSEQSGHWVFDVQYVNSDYFASCSTESSLKIWNSHTLKLEKEFFGHETNTMINSLLVLNSNIVVTGGSDSNIFVWDIKKGNYVCILTGHNEWVTKLVKVSDWEFLSLGNDRVVNLWNILKKKSVAHYIGHKGKINDMTHLRYTDIFLTCSDDKTIRGWSLLESNACVFIYNVPINISTSPQSILQIKDDYFLTGHQHYILVWKISTAQVMKQFKAHNDYVSGLKLMNGDCFASLSLDKTFSLYQIEGLKLIANFNGHQNQVTGISSLDLNTIITSSLDHTIKIWK